MQENQEPQAIKRPSFLLRLGGVLGILFILLALVLMLGLTCGSIRISLGQLFHMAGTVLRHDGRPFDSPMIIAFQIRLPRLLLAACVGAALAMAGVAFQGLLRNPLADPYIIGTSSGASLGAVLSIVLGLHESFLGISPIPFMAFIGAIASMIAVYLMAQKNGKLPMDTFLLAGVIVGSFMGALVSFLMTIAQEDLPKIIFWLMGSFSGREDWKYILILLPYLIPGSIILYLYSHHLNLLTMGEESALHKGIDVERTKIIIVLAASLVTAAAVSVSGLIGFVGLMIPHVMRMILGPDHRILLPASALAGAIFLALTDTMARTLFLPEELPVGVITALLGAPFFFILLRMRKSYV
jgi:iron complex transport system permease protein